METLPILTTNTEYVHREMVQEILCVFPYSKERTI